MDKRLKAYLADPENEKNIHDIRTSVRRFDVTVSLLPKKIRSRYQGRIEKYKAFLRESSKARDCDIIVGRIAALTNLDIADLQEKKRVALSRVTALARSLKKLPPIKLAAEDNKRVGKVVDGLIEKIGRTLPQVLSADSNVKELHRLRKGLRKLRYILEMMPAIDRKKYLRKAEKVVEREIELKELQALLGLIHDSDVTIEYLRSRPDAKNILGEEVAARQQLYKKFARFMKK